MLNKKVISFCLFNYNQIFHDRWWDDYKMDLYRYYYNIPFLLIQLYILFPDFQINFYVESIIDKNFLNLLKIGKVNLIIMDTNIEKDMSKTMWRYIPIFESDCDLVFPRDIDSIISKEEIECYNKFQLSNYNIMTIRSKTEHSHEVCKMLAGMSGFKPLNLKLNINVLNKAIENNKQLSCDQTFLIKTFTSDEYLSQFIDFRIHEQNELPKIKCDSVRIDDQIPYDGVFKLIKDFELCKWAGEPCEARKEPLKELFSLINNDYSNIIKSYIENNKEIKEFYL